MNKQLAILAIIALIYFNAGHGASIVAEGEFEATGELQLTEDQCRALNDGKVDTLEAVQLRGHLYSALAVDIKDIIIAPQINCWALFDRFMKRNKEIFQAWANRNCRPFIGCWCCPNGGLCITFIVRPNRILCIKPIDIIFKARIPLIEPQLQLELQCA